MNEAYVLLIGTVTQSQYRPYNQELLRKGMEPQFVRVSDSTMCRDELGIADHELVAKRAGISAYELANDIEDPYELLWGFIEKDCKVDPKRVHYILFTEEHAGDYLSFDLLAMASGASHTTAAHSV